MNPAPPREYGLADFDFTLPPELIAQHPAAERSASRLLDGRGALPVDRVFRDLPALLQPGDLLVCNDTRVIKARLLGEKPTGGSVEALVGRGGAINDQFERWGLLRADAVAQAGNGPQPRFVFMAQRQVQRQVDVAHQAELAQSAGWA